MIRINASKFKNKEWLITNGLGGYSSSTLQNINTRKFHGLLVASLSPPCGRWVILSALNEQIKIKNRLHFLKEQPVEYISRHFPTFIYDIGKIQINKTVMMPYMQNTTIIKYEFQPSMNTDGGLFILSPCLNSRHFYNTTPRDSITFHQECLPKNKISVHPSNKDIEIILLCEDAHYKKDECWFDCEYPYDKTRNEDCYDSIFQIGYFVVDISRSKTFYFMVTIDKYETFNAGLEYSKEKTRRQNLVKHTNLPEKTHNLVLFTDAFIVKRNNGNSIIAGYHWFSDWGRDCFVSLPGLTLVTKRFDVSKKIILTFGKYCKNGLIPNAFLDKENTPIYNAVDASLWYIDSIFQYFKYTNDVDFIRKIFPVMKTIINHYINGTDFGIKMDVDYLIKHGPGLTWMDIKKAGNNFITPRAGKAVEIQALWYNALNIMHIFSNILGENNDFMELKKKVKDNFIKKFTDYYDVIEPKDVTIRPNLIFLVSLDFSMLNSDMQKKIVTYLETNLLTKTGLRTLSKNSPQYFGNFLGWHDKDIAYHNGCIWPWLTGEFVRSFLKIKKHKKKWRMYAYENFISPLLNPEIQQCVGYAPEIFDGDEPHAPNGCVSQAWNTAEILRTYVEDIMFIRPKYEHSLVKVIV